MKIPSRAAALLLLAAFPSAQAASVLLVTNGTTPDTSEADLVTLLTGAGHVVTTASQGGGLNQIGGTLANDFTPGVSKSQYMNQFGAVVIARTTTSSNFNDKPGWAALTTGVLNANSFAARGISAGTGFFSIDQGGEVSLPNLGNPDAVVLSSSHPIWNGVNILDGKTNLWADTGGGTVAGYNVTSATQVGDGLILGRLDNNNHVFLAAWETGDTLGSGNDAQGRRVAFFLTGNGDASTNNSTSLTADGELAFVNAVNWVIPEPSSAILVVAGALALGLRRRRD